MKKVIVLVFLAIIALVLFRGQTVYQDAQYQPQKSVDRIEVEQEKVLKRLSQAITYPTISTDNLAKFDGAPFTDFLAFMEQSFPLVSEHAQRQIINDYSVIYHFAGADKSLDPILLMGHMDVVPVDQATLNQWTNPPFAGVIDDNFVWGRGAIDDKSTVMALMEAMELLIANGHQLTRSVYFAFGHDEEVGGQNGAQRVSQYFQEQNIRFEFVLDEGGAIIEGMMPNVEQPVAIIGIAEKGFVNLKLSVSQEGGHSSTPPNNTALGVLAQAIVKLENNQFPTTLTFTNQTFDAVGHYADYPAQVSMANQWLLSPLIESVILANPKSAASVRTTMATTMAEGSSKSNILPTKATMTINFRTLPGDTWQSVQERVTEIIDDPRVEVSAFMQSDPSPVSSTDSYGFTLIEQTIREFDNNLLVAPYLVQGGTDSKYFYPVSDSIYRFLMVRLDHELVSTMHGIDERIRKKDYVEAIQFFYELLTRV